MAQLLQHRHFGSYPQYSQSGVEWLNLIPSHWGIRLAKRLFAELVDRDHPDEPLLSATQSTGVVPRQEAEMRVWNPGDDVSTYKLTQPGDFVISLRSFQGGIEFNTYRGIVSPAYTVLRPKVDLDVGFFRYFFKSFPFVTALNAMTTGIRQGKTISYADFGLLQCVLPPKAEQRTIANFLDRETARIDALLTKKERLIELLQEKRTALITRAVTKGLDPNAPMKDSGVEWLGEIPAYWEVKRLWHLTPSDRRIMYGIVLPGPNVTEGVPIVKGGDVSAERLRLERLNQTTLEIESAYARSRLRAGDLVFAIRGSIGQVAIVPSDLEGANLTQDAARVSYTSATHGKWLFYALKSAAVFAQLERGALGATIRGINIRDLKRASIPVPQRQEQEEIAAFLDREMSKVNALTAKVREGIDRLKEYRTALISTAVTGKIDVRNYLDFQSGTIA